MHSLVSPSLPGQPASPAEEQPIAKLERIDALHQIAHLGRNTLFIELASLAVELQEIIDELLWNDGDGGIALAEAAEEAARELPLDVEYFGRWAAGTTPTADGVSVCLCFGGPTVRISTSIDHRGNCVAEETEGQFSWGGQSGTIDAPAHYHDSLEWFWGLVAC